MYTCNEQQSLEEFQEEVSPLSSASALTPSTTQSCRNRFDGADHRGHHVRGHGLSLKISQKLNRSDAVPHRESNASYFFAAAIMVSSGIVVILVANAFATVILLQAWQLY